MRKNVASQVVAFQAVSSTDGSAVTTGTPAVYYTIDGGAQGTGGGATAVHEGNGQWSYVPLQAETNGDHVAFTFVLSGAISQCVNVYPVSYDPTDSVRMGITALPNAAADAAGGLAISDAGGLDLDAVLSGHVPQTGDTYALANGATGFAAIDTVVDTILVDTNELQTNQGNWLTATGFATHSAADVWAVATRVLTANTNLNDPTSAAIADAVWLETLADHSGSSGSTAEALNAAGAAGDPWTTALPGAYGAGSAGNIVGNLNDLDAAGIRTAVGLAAANLDTQLGTIVADTGELQTNQGNWLTATGFSTHSAANVRTEMDSNSTQLAAIVADTNELQTDWANDGRLDLILDARASQTTADAIETDTQDIQSRIPAALVSGRIDATVDGTGMEAGATAAIATAVLTTAMTEAYAANGADPTLTQAVLATHQMLMDFDISGTALTVRKLDSSTQAFVVTLDDATSPTAAERV